MKEAIQANINFERINLLYRGAPITVPDLIVGFLSLFFTAKDLLPANYLMLWSSAFSAVLLWRLTLIFNFKRLRN